MKGLLIKDFTGLKGYGRIVAIMIVMYTILAFISSSMSMLTSILMVFCAVMPMNSTALDEQAKWYAYAQTMPISRGQIVLAKYLMVTIMGFAAAALSLLMTLVAAIRTPINWLEQFQVVGVMFCMVVISNALSLPMIFKLGVEKARLVIMFVYMLCMLPTILTMSGGMSVIIPLSVLGIGLLAIAAAMFVGSYFVSLKIYENKEL